MKNLIIVLLILLSSQMIFAQNENISLGAQYTGTFQRQGGLYDYSDPETINMRVSVWGFVKYPGRYLVPIYTSVSDLLSYAGGPTDASDLEDLRLYRVMEDSTQHLFKFNFNDLLWSEKLEEQSRKIPKLQGSDLLVVPGAPRLYFTHWFRVGLSIFSAMVSLALLIIRLR
ncbi:MAG: SLBB domain-containing protein [Ignavibacteriae bacterium]|nr:SLBB domain-containing protein [Ignavibacteriota bacterium]MCB0751251.1 SLBB domain-containing protein [Ignavibacteriota bacterium]MCB9207967.1 SLBB domain-containing protein [Ignavibacteriales bacterium]MCB9258736.1 SLBB domain-containing protein [Ignavibacteriales bacterium]